MSYSIPASADPANGPAQNLQEVNFGEPELSGGDSLASIMMAGQSTEPEKLQIIPEDSSSQRMRQLNQLIRNHQQLSSGAQVGLHFLQQQQQQQQETGERRDVVSVSQCCNMMETEDVSISGRAQTTRRSKVPLSAH